MQSCGKLSWMLWKSHGRNTGNWQLFLLIFVATCTQCWQIENLYQLSPWLTIYYISLQFFLLSWTRPLSFIVLLTDWFTIISIIIHFIPCWQLCYFFNRDNAKRLVYENDMLQMQMSSNEKDTLDVISYLKQEDGKKDEQVRVFAWQVKNATHGQIRAWPAVLHSVDNHLVLANNNVLNVLEFHWVAK